MLAAHEFDVAKFQIQKLRSACRAASWIRFGRVKADRLRNPRSFDAGAPPNTDEPTQAL
jgi:hypothetical protein